MGFHNLPRPSDWVTVVPPARAGMVYDQHLTSGNVTCRLAWNRQPISETFTGTNGTNPIGAYTTIGHRLWQIGNGTTTWEIQSNTVRYTGTNSDGSLWVAADSVDADVTVQCRTTSGQVGLIIRDQDVPGNFVCLEPGFPPRLIITFVSTDWTGSTVIAADTWYTLRVVTSGNTWSVYLNGVLEGSFTSTRGTTNPDFGIGTWQAVGNQFRNFAIAGINHAATNYKLYNFYGTKLADVALNGTEEYVSIPDASLTQLHGGPYGSYDMFLFGADRGTGYKASYGEAHFLRIKDDAAFPGPVAQTVAQIGTEWEVRARCQMGPGATRLNLDITADNVTALNSAQAADADYLVTNYVAYQTARRPRRIIGHFPNYTPGLESRVTATVSYLKAHGVTAWEPRNEPQGTPADTYVAEQAAFYAAVKAGDASAIVLGPNPVGYSNNGYGAYSLSWIIGFLNAGGGAYCDQFSMHGYGDQTNTARAMSDLDALIPVLAGYGFTVDKIWQTEGGQYFPLFGSVRPQSYIMQILSQELVGIRWEHNVPWYDLSHGFWDFASFWIAGDSSYPHGLTPRTFISEIGDRLLEHRFDFGGADNKLYLGGVWLGVDGSRTVAVRAENSWLPAPVFATNAASIVAVDMFGNTFTLTASGGKVTVPADPNIVYLRIPAGVTCTPVPRIYPNGIAPTTTAAGNNVANLTNGILEDNWGTLDGTPIGSDKPYNSQAETFPHSIVFDFPVARIARVLVLPLTTGWNWSGISDITVDVWIGGAWVQVYSQTNTAAASFEAYTYLTNSRWQEYWEPPKVFDATFAPVVTTKVRVNVNAVSVGTFATLGAFNAWWLEYNNPPHSWFAIRDIQIYDSSNAPVFPGSGASALTPATSRVHATFAAPVYVFSGPQYQAGDKAFHDPRAAIREGTSAAANQLGRHYNRSLSISVLKIAGTYVAIPNPSLAQIASATEVYMGGRDYPVSLATKLALEAAGFTVKTVFEHVE